MGNDYNISNLNLHKNMDLNGYSSNTSKISGENELLFNYNAHKKVSDDEIMGFQRSNNDKTIKSDELINKKIERAKQGNLGDCWLLAQINALADTEFGAELIKNAITINPNGTYTVTLKGADKEYTVTKSELKKAMKGNKHSKGDPDMRLLELVFEKYYKEASEQYIEENKEFFSPEKIKKLREQTPIDGGNYYRMGSQDELSQDIVFLLGGKDYKSYAYDDKDDILNMLKKKSRFPSDIIITIGTEYDIKSGKLYKEGAHALSIKNVQTDSNGNLLSIDFVDPHDNSKVITKNVDEVIPLIHSIHVSASKNQKNNLIKYEIKDLINFWDISNHLDYSLLVSISMDDKSADYKKIFVEEMGGLKEMINNHQKLLEKETLSPSELNKRKIFFLMHVFPQGDNTIKKDLPEDNLLAYYNDEYGKLQASPMPVEEGDIQRRNVLNETVEEGFGCGITELLNSPEKIEKLCKQYGYKY